MIRVKCWGNSNCSAGNSPGGRKCQSGGLPSGIHIPKKLSVLFVADCMNTAIYDRTFPHELKIGEILLVFKNNELTVEIILTPSQ